MVACHKENENNVKDFKIEGISTANYPNVDGSTSTTPLQYIIACRMLGISYEWMPNLVWDGVYFIAPSMDDDPDRFIAKTIRNNGTHSAYLNLLDKKSDIILVARKASADELSYADSLGITLIETPVALDAFVFITNQNNPVKSLTTEQIQNIYTGEIVNWNQVGGDNAEINPYVRNANSGSQELMESLVMKDLNMPNLPEAV